MFPVIGQKELVKFYLPELCLPIEHWPDSYKYDNFFLYKNQVFGGNFGEVLEVLDEMLEVLEAYHCF